MWEKVPFAEFVFYQEGPGLRNWQWKPSGMKVINVSNIIGDGTIDTTNTDKYISEDEFLNKYKHFEINAGDIVVASSGNTYGKIGRISVKDLPLMMNTSVIRCRSKDTLQLDNEYLYLFIRSKYFKDQIEAYVTGSAQPNFGPSHIKQMYLLKPTIEIQQKIAKIINPYDELIENNLRRIQLLEESARCEYKIITENSRVKKPLNTFTSLIKRGISPKYVEQEGLIVVNQKCIRGLPIDFTFSRLTDKNKNVSSERMLSAYDTVINSTGTGTLGRVSIFLDAEIVSTVDSHVTIVRANEKTPPLFLAMSIYLKKDIISMMGEGSTNQTELSPKRLGQELMIPEISNDLMKHYHDTTAKQFELIWNLQKQNNQLRQARDILLPRLMSGEIEV